MSDEKREADEAAEAEFVKRVYDAFGVDTSGVRTGPKSAWTPELLERFVRLADAHAEGRFDEQFDAEFPKGPQDSAS
jgi:hypothetical protein